jgi:solute carrier family 13 (sodium-dependent dicarboxylate transporter), member 2/3/5
MSEISKTSTILSEQLITKPKLISLVLATLVLAAAIAWPTPAGLPVAGKYMLGLFLFAIIIWMTEAINYPVSGVVIASLMTILLGIAPDVAKPSHILGTTKALGFAMSGFTNSGVVLIAAALFVAEAMTVTGLDKRIALNILSRVGNSTRGILIGVLVAQCALSFVLPSTTARVGCLAPIILGIVAAMGLDRRSRFSGMLMIAVTQSATISIMAVKTGAAANLITIGFMQTLLHTDVTWLSWFIVASPFALIMTVALYFIMVTIMPPEMRHVEGGDLAIRQAVLDLGPMTRQEKKLVAILVVLLGFWVTEGVLHNFDTSTTTITAIALMFLPGISIMKWKHTEKNIAWGIIVLTAVGVSLGTAILVTHAATWLTNFVVAGFGLQYASAFVIFAVISLFMIVIHLGFNSAPALVSTMIPVVIAVLLGAHNNKLNIPGLTLMLGFVASFGFVLPVSGPHHMIALGTETFRVGDFIKVGVSLAVFGYILLLIFGLTYWKWLGYV